MPKRRMLLRSALSAVAAALLLVTMTPQSASARSFSPVTTVYAPIGGYYCVRAEAGIDHYVPGTFSGNYAYANAYLLWVRVDLSGRRSCELEMTGWGRTRLDVQKWNGSAWTFCRGSDWAYGNFGWSGGEMGGPTGPSKSLNYGGSAACGEGYYRTMATAEYEVSPSTWVGGSVASPYEWVP